MRSFAVVVRPDASALLVGGHSESRHGADRATARDVEGRPMLPASALRGALRIELERLLRGLDGSRTACSANLAAPAADGAPCQCPVCRLFGSEGSASGTLRLEDARLSAEVATPVEESRPGVGVGRRTRTVVAKHLTFAETSGVLNAGGGDAVLRAAARLVPRGAQDGEASLAEDWRHLAAACAALNGLGGGKARGLGWVQCSLEPPALPPATVVESVARDGAHFPGATGTACVCFEALAPLHLGQGRQIAFFQPSLEHAPGSTVRGALAFALLENGLAKDGDTAFATLFDPRSGVSFGAARTAGDIPSATRRKCRAAGHVFDDLVGELVRRRAAGAGLALAVSSEGACLERACGAQKLVPEPRRRGTSAPVVRVRTRTALNRLTGTAMDRKLYSLAALEPSMPHPGGQGSHDPLVLEAEVRGLTAETLALLASLDAREAWLGGKRSRGMGRCHLALRAGDEPSHAKVRERIEALAAELAEAWSAVRQTAGERLPEPFVPADRVPVAIVLAEPWAPLSEGLDLFAGPLAGHGAELVDAFLSTSEEGRFGANEASWYGAPQQVLRGEASPVRAVAAGSVYVYSAVRTELDVRLAEWIALGWAGSGLHREMGWGRFVIRGPEVDF